MERVRVSLENNNQINRPKNPSPLFLDYPNLLILCHRSLLSIQHLLPSQTLLLPLIDYLFPFLGGCITNASGSDARWMWRGTSPFGQHVGGEWEWVGRGEEGG